MEELAAWGDFILKLVELVFSNIFVVFFLLLFVLPMMARRRRFADLITAFAKLQKKRKSKIITLVHRMETMGFLGIPRFGYIDLNDAEEIIAAIRSTPADKPLEIMLHTPGGLVLAAHQIAKAVKDHPGPTTVYIPHFAMSGGTLIALAADQVVMTSHAIMGPIDPQIDGLPAASIIRVRDTKSPDAIEDYTLMLADISEMAIEQVRVVAQSLLQGTVSDERAAQIADQLSTGNWTHDHPIYADDARSLGLKVSTDMPADFLELMGLFPNTMAQQSGVRHLREMVFGPTQPKQKGSQRGVTGDGGQMEGPMPAFPSDGVRRVHFGPWNAQELEQRGQFTSRARNPEKIRHARRFYHGRDS